MDGWMKNWFPKTMLSTEAHHQDMVLGWENRNDCRKGLKYIYIYMYIAEKAVC